MKLNQYVLLMVWISGVVVWSGCKGLNMESDWKRSAIDVNGKYGDWEGYRTLYDEEKGLIFSAASNEKEMYLMLRFRDRRLANQFENRGATLWVEAKNKSKRKIGIHYRNDSALMDMDRAADNMNPGEQENPMERIKPPAGYFTFYENEKADEMALSNAPGMKARAGLSDGVTCYEFRIPLVTPSQGTYGLTAVPGDKIKVGMVIAAMSDDMKAQMTAMMKGNGGRAGMRGGGRMPGGGGGPGGGRPGVPGNNMNEFKTRETWITVQLAIESKSNEE